MQKRLIIMILALYSFKCNKFICKYIGGLKMKIIDIKIFTVDYAEGHTIGETKTYAEQFGIHSYYHAKAISGRSGNGATKEIPITTITMGNIGFATIPGELFDVCGQYIKENSPMDMTFVMGYCNGAVGYLPSEYAFSYGSYEVDITAFVMGTAEAVAKRHVEILTEMSAK